MLYYVLLKTVFNNKKKILGHKKMINVKSRPFLGIPNYHIKLRKSGVGYLTKSELPKQLPSGFVIDSRRCKSYRKKLD